MVKVNNIFFFLFLLGLTFGVVFYDFIKFSYTDEILCLLLVGLSIFLMNRRRGNPFLKPYIFTIAVLCFYLIYSLLYRVNSKEAVFLDFFIQSKPFLAFFATLIIAPSFSTIQKKTLKKIIILFAIWMLGIACLTYTSSFDAILYFMVHPSRFATASIILGLLYYFISENTKRDRWITFAIILISILSFRSKAYVFCGLAYLFLFQFKVNYLDASLFKKIVLGIILTVCVFIAGWSKFEYYFIQGSKGVSDASQIESDMYARPALYLGAYQILQDYIPFGSGYGSYATYASEQYYSPIYGKYDLDLIHGLSPDYSDFICDSFYPELAQFGFVGVFLFFYFLFFIYKQALVSYNFSRDLRCMLIAFLGIIFFLVESSSDSTFTHNRGMFLLIIMAMCINTSKCNKTNIL